MKLDTVSKFRRVSASFADNKREKNIIFQRMFVSFRQKITMSINILKVTRMNYKAKGVGMQIKCCGGVIF